jgi:thiamine-monophosphate kinase
VTAPGAAHDRIRLGPGAEFDVIRRFLEVAAAVAPPPGVLVGPGDDCAVVRAEGLAISTDATVEGVHFRREWIGAEEIGWRAAAVALSDLAGVAARPLGLLVTMAAPAHDVPAFVEQVMRGVGAAAAGAGAALLGGDLTASPAGLFLDVVVLGEAAAPVLRSGARPGDSLWVTGALGGAAAAVEAWTQGREPPPAAREAFARPRPRWVEALWLRDRGVLRAMLDLSDGLAGDAGHLAAASGVGVLLDPRAVPVAPAAAEVGGSPEAALRLALGGGEDYELCFAAAPGAVEPLAEEFAGLFGLRLTRVGQVTAGAGVACLDPDGRARPLELAGFRHFEEGTR